MVKIYDTIIIGGGPAGVSAALHLAYHDRTVLVMDRGTSPMHFHTNSILNYSGSVYHEGRSLLRNFQGEARAAGAEFKAADVVKIAGRYPKFTVRTSPSYRTQDEGVGNGAFYCPDCEAPLCKDKEVLIVNAGTAGSAIHVANSLTRFTDKIQILMTEDAYMPFEKNDFSKLNDSPFEWTSGKIKAIDFPRPGVIQSVTLEDGRKLKANVFFVSFVDVVRSELAQQIGVEVDRKGNILTDHRGKTNIEGVWAAGDVRPITQQVAMAVGTGNYAALMMNQFLGNDHEQGEEFDHPDHRRALHIE
ncbi:MAG: NAD(P)/FAD-dependent oxidoreductase [Candidatus Thorarchaeota archaeon]|jgi:thioredoxin reductase (NADPH)